MSVSNDTSGRKQAVAVRNIEFYRPEADTLPWSLLLAGAAEFDEDQLRCELDLDYTRIACQIEPAQTLGIYAMRRHNKARFEMISLSVVQDYEHQLLGRRLLGHALGLAESKAGRDVELSVCAGNARALAMLEQYGFLPLEQAGKSGSADSTSVVRLHFELTPE